MSFKSLQRPTGWERITLDVTSFQDRLWVPHFALCGDRFHVVLSDGWHSTRSACRLLGRDDRRKSHAGHRCIHVFSVSDLCSGPCCSPRSWGEQRDHFPLVSWVDGICPTRSQVLVVRELPYVEAARAIGMPEWRIVFSHVIPNSISPLVVAISLFVGRAILTESGSAFLGLGAEPPLASWGKELRAGFTYLERSPLLSAVPGFMITLVVSAFNFLGDGLRDAIDPHMRGEG